MGEVAQLAAGNGGEAVAICAPAGHQYRGSLGGPCRVGRPLGVPSFRLKGDRHLNKNHRQCDELFLLGLVIGSDVIVNLCFALLLQAFSSD
jgi:hypothetical protein